MSDGSRSDAFGAPRRLPARPFRGAVALTDEILGILVPIYTTVLLGYGLGRIGFSWDAKTISPLVLQVTFPLLVIHQFTRPGIETSGVITMFMAALLVVGGFFVIFGLLCWLAKLPIRTYLGAAALSNMSIGLAVGYLGFGEDGFAMTLAFGSVVLLAQFTLGRWVPAGLGSGGHVDLGRPFRRPFIYVLALGILLLFMGIHLPVYIGKTLHLVGQLTIPLLLLSLGFALAAIHFQGIGRSLLMTVVHLGICLAVGVAAVWLLGLEGQDRALVILLSIMPSSTINILMGREEGADVERLTIFVACSNLWLIVSLPVALVLLLS